MFQMRAALLWSINDFPAYANLSGWSTKGEYACPNCNTTPGSRWLKHGHKWSYGRSRRYLPYDHKYRKDRNSFYDKKAECDGPPPSLNGVQRLAQLHANGVLTQYKKEDMLIRHKMGPEKVEKDPMKKRRHNWKKKSIFYELSYWKHNLLQYSIDPMHCEKNMAENAFSTTLGVKGKTKDNLSSRRDLKDWGIREEYHVREKESGAEYFDRAEFEMDNEGKDKFLLGLSEARMPDGYCSSIARRVNLKDRTISGLKSHDYHILLQQLIPLCVRSSLPNNVVSGLIGLGMFFKTLCSKVNSSKSLEEARSRLIVTLCDLEKIFPPSFFDVMEHLPIYLVDEALIGGAVHFRWMYPIERFLLTLKNYVRQHACPEASIAKGYLMEECMNFCSQYLKDVESKTNRPPRRKNDVEKKGKAFILSEVARTQVHRWVLFHTKAITTYLNEHVTAIKNQNPDASEESVMRTQFNEFASWFKDHVKRLQEAGDMSLTEEIVALSHPPSPSVAKLNSCTSNGYFFRVKHLDNKRTRQNCGVYMHDGSISYYGKLTDIIKVTYSVDVKYVMFKCEWAHPTTGVKLDPFKFTLVNFQRLLYKNDRVANEPFILASQAMQVWYNPDPSGQGWLNVREVESKEYSHVHTYIMDELDGDDNSIDELDGDDDSMDELDGGND